MEIAGFKIYYGDGSVYESGDWADAPSDNVQVVIIFYRETYRIFRDGQCFVEPYRLMLHSKDYYWNLADDYGAGAAKEVPKDASIKLGKWVDKQTWREIIGRAHADLRSRLV